MVVLINLGNFGYVKSFYSFAPNDNLGMEESKIKEIGEALFMTYGVRSVSMDDIARHLGISKKTLYQHFKDKNELVKKVTESVIGERKSEYEAVTNQAKNAIEELYLMSKCFRSHIEGLNPSLVFDLKKFHTEAWDLFLDFEHITIFESLVDNLKRGKEEGFFRAEISINVLAKLRVEQVHMSFDPHVFPKDEFDFTEVHMQMFEHYVYGLLTIKGLKLFEKYKQEN
ncbi:MAG: TetR/AcrR family transcriptional regulator [Cyclobacteriaceae bacterium]|nr:TetR/AcrR family transcriptional regulator [Cyclobacteriaceae bacterium]